MAVEFSNDFFDWCTDLCYAKTNYTDEECLDLLKKSLSACKDIDNKYLEFVKNLEMKDVTFLNSYIPVYLLKITATYVTESETKRYTKSYIFEKLTYKRADLKPEEFVGRSDQRFYNLSHVDDLAYPFYNFNYAYTSSQMQYRVIDLARAEHPGSCTVNGYTCTAIFVPVVSVKIKYNNKEYECTINKHNGVEADSYMVSEKAASIVKTEYSTFNKMRIAGFSIIAITAITLIVYMIMHEFILGCAHIIVFGGADAILLWRLSSSGDLSARRECFEREYKKMGYVDSDHIGAMKKFIIIGAIIEIALVVVFALGF